ncbi:MAG TPA: DNA gyrase/topoisomerase IV subunit A, partial [Saprospiraceae bacterium]|nr:DNA gyrase/topoisomerase IV subunit A [Saprospiraceae bacterium]
FASIKKEPRIEYSVKIKGKKIQGEVNLADFIDVKGWKAMGNKLSDQKLSSVKELEDPTLFQTPDSNAAEVPLPEKFHAGDSLEFDMGKNGQGSLF